jgi:hypothetical protein
MALYSLDYTRDPCSTIRMVHPYGNSYSQCHIHRTLPGSLHISAVANQDILQGRQFALLGTGKRRDSESVLSLDFLVDQWLAMEGISKED